MELEIPIPLTFLTLPYLRGGQAVTPAQRWGPMRVPECNNKVTGNGYEAVDGCEAVNKRLWSRNSTKALV